MQWINSSSVQCPHRKSFTALWENNECATFYWLWSCCQQNSFVLISEEIKSDIQQENQIYEQGNINVIFLTYRNNYNSIIWMRSSNFCYLHWKWSTCLCDCRRKSLFEQIISFTLITFTYFLRYEIMNPTEWMSEADIRDRLLWVNQCWLSI